MRPEKPCIDSELVLERILDAEDTVHQVDRRARIDDERCNMRCKGQVTVLESNDRDRYKIEVRGAYARGGFGRCRIQITKLKRTDGAILVLISAVALFIRRLLTA